MRGILPLAALTIAAALAAARAAETPPGSATDRSAGPGSAAPVPARPLKTEAPPAKPGAPQIVPTPRTADRGAKGKAEKKPEYRGPTEADIRTAYTLRVERINAGSAKYLSQEAAARLHIRLVKVDFIECEPVEDRTDFYLCNVLVESALGNAAPEFKRVEAVLAKEGDAWTVR